MLTLVPLFFLFNWMLSADSMAVPYNFPPGKTNQDIPLSMAEDSVDDMYEGCQQEMMEKVKSHYLEKEMQDEEFSIAWSNAAWCADKIPEENALTKDHMQAIGAYTSDDIYEKFNQHVREQRSVYGTTFKFHSLHFLLTSAIQILNSDNTCYTTYRRTRSTFTGSEGAIIRFGTFASSSFRTDLHFFGSQTCFKIKTCSGAYLKTYSVLWDKEEEVLIPPYETFKVTKKFVAGPGKYPGLEDCEVVYELESTGKESKLNCKAVNSAFRLQEMLPSSRFLTFITIATHLSFTLYIQF